MANDWTPRFTEGWNWTPRGRKVVRVLNNLAFYTAGTIVVLLGCINYG